MKFLFTTLIVILFINSVEADDAQPYVEWVRQLKGAGDKNSVHAIDSSGNIIVGGYFSDTLEFEDGRQIISEDSNDIFFAKYNSRGKLLAVNQFGGEGNQIVSDIAVDVSENYHLTGSFDNVIDLGNGFEKNLEDGDFGFFYAEIDSSGNCQNAVFAECDRAIGGKSIAANNSGDIFIAGDFAGIAEFDGGNSIEAEGKTDIFVLKISDGGISWIKTINGEEDVTASAVYTDDDGNVYLTGDFIGTIDFGNGNELSSRGKEDSFFAKYDGDGNVSGIHQIGGLANDAGKGVYVDDNNNIFASGYFSETANFGKDIKFASFGGYDNYAAKYDENMDNIWVVQTGGPWKDEALTINGFYGEYLLYGGIYQSNGIFGGGLRSTSRGGDDIYIIKLDKEGAPEWGYFAGGTENEYLNDVAVRSRQEIYATGKFDDSVEFSHKYKLRNNRGRDVFLMKLTECGQSSINYPWQHGNFNMKFAGSAKPEGRKMRLTPAEKAMAGAAWFSKKIPVRNGFTTEFTFRLSEGQFADDNSAPGADGIAFVIQSNADNEIGVSGGGIGFEGIPNSAAIEFDTHGNSSRNINDPNSNHIAVFSNGTEPNSNNHNTTAQLGAATDIVDFRADSNVYYVRIEYDAAGEELRVFLDTTGNFYEPALVITDFKLHELINLEDGFYSYAGFTAGTGSGYEVHEILDWHLCNEQFEPVVGVERSADREEKVISNYPNPFSRTTTIKYQIGKAGYAELSVYDVFGKKAAQLADEYHQAGEYSVEFDGADCESGVYYYILEVNSEKQEGKFILIK